MNRAYTGFAAAILIAVSLSAARERDALGQRSALLSQIALIAPKANPPTITLTANSIASLNERIERDAGTVANAIA